MLQDNRVVFDHISNDLGVLLQNGEQGRDKYNPLFLPPRSMRQGVAQRADRFPCTGGDIQTVYPTLILGKCSTLVGDDAPRLLNGGLLRKTLKLLLYLLEIGRPKRGQILRQFGLGMTAHEGSRILSVAFHHSRGKQARQNTQIVGKLFRPLLRDQRLELLVDGRQRFICTLK